VATWWLVGDLSETTSGRLTYVINAPSVPPGWARAIGIGSVVVYSVAAAATVHASVAGTWDPGWRWVITMVTGAGMIVGYGWRVLTAGVAGANQGAGVIVLLGIPIVLALLSSAAIRSYRLGR